MIENAWQCLICFVLETPLGPGGGDRRQTWQTMPVARPFSTYLMAMREGIIWLVENWWSWSQYRKELLWVYLYFNISGMRQSSRRKFEMQYKLAEKTGVSKKHIYCMFAYSSYGAGIWISPGISSYAAGIGVSHFQATELLSQAMGLKLLHLKVCQATELLSEPTGLDLKLAQARRLELDYLKASQATGLELKHFKLCQATELLSQATGWNWSISRYLKLWGWNLNMSSYGTWIGVSQCISSYADGISSYEARSWNISRYLKLWGWDLSISRYLKKWGWNLSISSYGTWIGVSQCISSYADGISSYEARSWSISRYLKLWGWDLSISKSQGISRNGAGIWVSQGISRNGAGIWVSQATGLEFEYLKVSQDTRLVSQTTRLATGVGLEYLKPLGWNWSISSFPAGIWVSQASRLEFRYLKRNLSISSLSGWNLGISSLPARIWVPQGEFGYSISSFQAVIWVSQASGLEFEYLKLPQGIWASQASRLEFEYLKRNLGMSSLQNLSISSLQARIWVFQPQVDFEYLKLPGWNLSISSGSWVSQAFWLEFEYLKPLGVELEYLNRNLGISSFLAGVWVSQASRNGIWVSQASRAGI